eukprot:gene30909-35961_t
MYDPCDKGTFSSEDIKRLHELVEEHKYSNRNGERYRWSTIGQLLGRSAFIWKWSSEEENRLRLLVTENMAARKEKEAAEKELRLKLSERWSPEEEKRIGVLAAEKELMLQHNPSHYKDGINFEPISDSLGTRAPSKCFAKWYSKLSSSVFSSGEWALEDDITLVRALKSAGYESWWEADWGRLVPNRAAEHAKRRWKSMLKTLPDYLEKSFDVCVEELAEKYSSHRCRQVLENFKS